MEASDMLDVLHYFMDEDMRYTGSDEFNFHSVVRKVMFTDLYGIPYKYGSKTDSSSSTEIEDPLAVKPYIPPTEFNGNSANPFGSVLDAPIG
jgi:hypothetical protein